MTESEYTIDIVKSETEKMHFIKFPWQIYKNYTNWVPPLIFNVKNNLDKINNPFYKHSKMEMWIAKKNGKIAGRIAGIINDNHNKKYNEKTGFFGFFECINDCNVSKLLFDTVSDYIRKEGMIIIRGPMNPSTNDECGLLIDGYEVPPVVLMPYNPEYYSQLIENYGFKKAKDLYAYQILGDEIINNKSALDKLKRVGNIVRKRENIDIRNINLKDFNNELLKVRNIYNNAWIENWGFIPMTEDEFKHIAKMLKPIVDPDLVFFAEYQGKPVGFSLSIPDINQILIKLNGRLFPFGIFKFLLNKGKINRLRVIIMGVIKEFHRKGIDAIFYEQTIRNGYRKKYRYADISWILEDNAVMVQTVEKLGAKRYKTYRIYDKYITS